jgi:hypothetical protein
LNQQYLAKKREEEKKAAAIMDESEDVEMKEIAEVEEAPLEPPPQTVMIDGKERKVTFDYYVHYVGHQRRNDRWCHQDEVKIDEEEIKRQF